MTPAPRTSTRRLVGHLYPSLFVGGTWTVVVLLTLALHGIAYLAMLAAPSILQQGALGYGAFRPWQLLSYMFLFDPQSPVHFLFSMTLFLMVAGDVSVIMGWRRFLLYYLACGLVAGLGSQLWLLACGKMLPGLQPMGVVGPTGAVCGLIFAFSHYFSRRRIYGFIPARLYCGFLTLLLVGGTMVYFTVQYGRGTGTPTLGLLSGVVGAVLYFTLEPRIRHWQLVRQTLRELDQIQQDAILEENLDSLLVKVKQHGAESLTPNEKRFLVQASRVASRRQRERS